jgi:hypothetical protein
MQSIAAYYVIVANDIARDSQKPRYRVAARPRLLGRIGATLAAITRPVRRTAAQAA